MCVNFSHFPINIFIFYFQVWIESALLPSTNVSGGVDVAVAESRPGTVISFHGRWFPVEPFSQSKHPTCQKGASEVVFGNL